MTTCGTPGYMAPEVIRKLGHGKPVDLWSIGVLTYFLLAGYTPFDNENNVEELHAILSADFKFDPEYWSDISAEAKDFIKKLIIVDPRKRMTAKEALAHPWLADNGKKEKHSFKSAVEAVKANNKFQKFKERRSIQKEVDPAAAYRPKDEDL